jgi:hypothetical protein
LIHGQVAWALQGEGAGLLIKPGEEHRDLAGRSFAAARLCYPGGKI